MKRLTVIILGVLLALSLLPEKAKDHVAANLQRTITPWGYNCLPAIHQIGGDRPGQDDWGPWGALGWFPRGWSTICYGHAPRLVWGNQLYGNCLWGTVTGPAALACAPKPIPPRGQWQVSWPPYMAMTGRNGLHCRLGARWTDSPDWGRFSYQIFSVAVRRLD